MLQINKCKPTLRLLQFWDSINFPNPIQDIHLLHYFDTTSRILTIQVTIVLHSDWEMVIWIGQVKSSRINEMTVTC